jgi:glycogen synthase
VTPGSLEVTGLPRRVLLTTDVVGGVWTFTAELCRELTARGVHVWLAALGGRPSAAQARDLAGVEQLTVLDHPGRLEWMADARDDVEGAGRWLESLVARFAPDVLHFNEFAHVARGWPVPAVLTAHSCVATWWEAVRREPLPAGWEAYSAMVRAAVRAAAVVTAPNRAMLDALADHHGVAGRAIAVPNGRSARDVTGVAKAPFALAAGRLWDEAKGIDVLEAAAPHCVWPIHVAGDRGAPSGAEMPLAHVHWLGVLDGATLARWMARASLYVWPARYEPFGYSVLEAAWSGCALVLSDIPTLREIWDGAARFVPPDAPDALAAAFNEVASDHRLRRHLASRARRRATFFTARRTASAYLRVYEIARSDAAKGAAAAVRQQVR